MTLASPSRNDSKIGVDLIWLQPCTKPVLLIHQQAFLFHERQMTAQILMNSQPLELSAKNRQEMKRIPVQIVVVYFDI